MIDTGNDINVFICVGNLPQDISINTTSEGIRTIAFFSVCTCRRSKKQDVSDVHNFIVKGELVNSPILDKLKRGARVHTEGVLTYTDGGCAEIQCTSIRLV